MSKAVKTSLPPTNTCGLLQVAVCPCSGALPKRWTRVRAKQPQPRLALRLGTQESGMEGYGPDLLPPS